jgi:metal-dependent amidase/aminoacylase/carboxypeptidase family protein
MSELPPCPDRDLMLELSETRQRFHRMPELSWTEYLTTARLCQELEALGYAVEWGDALYREPPGNPDSVIQYGIGTRFVVFGPGFVVVMTAYVPAGSICNLTTRSSRSR